MPRIAVSCPSCESRYIETTRRIWFLYGFLVLSSYGAKTVIGCRQCVQRDVWKNSLKCLLFGWWCIPWGVGVPFVLVQNIYEALRAKTPDVDRRELQALLENVGISLNDVEIDSEGFTREQREIINRLHVVLHESIHADGIQDPAEMELAQSILVSISGNTLSSEQAYQQLKNRPKAAPRLDEGDYEQRVMLLEAAIAIIGADGVASAKEMAFINDIGRRLALPPAVVERIVARILFDVDEETHSHGFGDDYTAACEVLGVSAHATLDEIRNQYRKVILKVHPDVAARHGMDQKQATEITQRINWAYAVLKEQAVPVA